MKLTVEQLKLYEQRRKALITDQKILEVMLKHSKMTSDDRYLSVCHEVLGYTRLGNILWDTTEIDRFDERYQVLELRLVSEDWITGRAFPAEVGKSYKIYFGRVDQKFAYATVRVDTLAASGWIDLETGAPLDPKLARFVVQAFIPLT